MARLAAIEKGLFYPTPERVIDLILEAVKLFAPFGGRLLDPCAGEGVAGHLARAWGLQSYGVELHGQRSKRAATIMDHVLHGSFHQLRCGLAGFNVLYLNPPYDTVEGEERSARQETEFLRGTRELLCPGGLIILVVPGAILDSWAFRELLTSTFMDLQVARFPDGEFEAFKQVIIFGRKRGGSPGLGFRGYSYLTALDAKPIGEEGYGEEHNPIILPELTEPLPAFELKGRGPFELAPGRKGGAYRTRTWRMLVGELDACAFDRPLLAPRPGHVAMLLAAGALNGTELDGKIIKGASSKITVEGRDEDAGIEFSRERIVSRMAVLDLKSGEVESWRTDERPTETKEWFERHGPALAASVRRDHPPLHDGSFDHLDWSKVEAPATFAGHTEPMILDAQKRAAAAAIDAWKRDKSVLIVGEMGTGKTTVGTIATTLAGMKKVVVLCPTHLCRKWVREVDKITKRKGTARHAETNADVDAFFADPDARYLILSKERAKLGAKWSPAYAMRFAKVQRMKVDQEATSERLREAIRWGRKAPDSVMREATTLEHVPSCPDCGKVIRGGGEEGVLRWLARSKRSCAECDGALWQAMPISAKGTKRWPLAKLIAENYARRYTLIVDELHQYASSSSDQGRAMQLLGSAARKLLVMTGTLYGGRASSIFFLLYRVDPDFRQLYGYHEAPRFVNDHGLLETVTKIEEHTSTYGTRRGNTGERTREVPGVNPAMLNLLLRYTVFIKLKDLGHELPPFTEEVRVLDHDPEVAAAAVSMMSEARKVLRKHPDLLGQYLMACLGYPDCPEHEESIVDPEDGVIASAPAFHGIWPKDRELAKIAREEKAHGRKVLAFFTQTGKRSPIARVRAHLESCGLRVLVLDAGVAAPEREEWLQKQGTEFDVMLTNGKLVETGLDLLFATTIVQYGTEYSIPTLRQSTRRSWRLGQTLAVRVIYLAYRRTMQEIAMRLIARKMRAAEMVDGDDLGGLASHDEEGHDFFMALAKEAAEAA